MKSVKNIKNQNGPTISKERSNAAPIRFSFQYFTDKKDYTFHVLKTREQAEYALDFMDKLREWSKLTMLDLMMRDKRTGIESIPVKELSESLQNHMKECPIISEDSKIFVLRFNQQKARMLCKPDLQHSFILHVLAFDLNFTAYNHGN